MLDDKKKRTIDTDLDLSLNEIRSQESHRDKKIREYKEQLNKLPEEYFIKHFNAHKKSIANPESVWNLQDVRDMTRLDGIDCDVNKLNQIQGEIWGRTLLYTSALANVITQVIKEGGNPKNDPLVQNHLAAVNLITLQYGVLYCLARDSSIGTLLIHDEGFKFHSLWGATLEGESFYLYDVALSYAEEQREYAEDLAKKLKEKSIRVYYDKFESANEWGKNLYQHLNKIYKENSCYTIVFVSKEYANQPWAKHELSSAQARAFTETREYILPLVFDETIVPGLDSTTGYINANESSPAEVSKLIQEKLDML
jgi:hypothetical protein